MQSQIPLTNETLAIKNTIDHIANAYNDENFLQRFQYIIKEYMVHSNNRGLLLYNSPGFGKSITAAAISEEYRKLDPSRKIVILLPKSLQNNFKKNIRKYMFNNKDSHDRKTKTHIDDIIENKYKFISLNAGNMYQQISDIDKTSKEIDFDKQLEQLNEHIYKSTDFLEHSLLIIDEVHNLNSAIKNGSKNAVKLYHTIMKTKDIKLLFLTGTPIVNSPYELVPMFNILKGYIYYRKTKYTLFPESYDDFANFFLDRKTNTIKNKKAFQNRIIGLVAYYGNVYFENIVREGFPDEKPILIHKVHMSNQQFTKYQDARNLEEKEVSGKFKKESIYEGFAAKEADKSSHSYRIRSRQASNYCIPSYALETVQEKNKSKIIKNIYKITDSDLCDLDRFSPKFKAIINNIKANPNKLCYTYSEFVHGEGVNLFARVLEVLENYVYWRDADINKNNIDEFDLTLNIAHASKSKSKKVQKTYAIITGDVPITERDAIIKVANSKKNIHGEYISLLLISKSSAEGVTFKNMRTNNIMEPFWNYARIEQINARGSRLFAQVDLPKKDQTIQPNLYISTYPKNYNKEHIKERTTDEELLHLSIVGKKIRDQFELAIIESSVDCSINKQDLPLDIQNKINCYLCAPNNKPLYTTDLYHDININNCDPVNASEIQTATIIYDGVKYHYTRNPVNSSINIFEYDDTIGAYTEMKKNNNVYSEIIKKILNI